MPKENWKITFFGGPVDYGTAPYTQVAKSTLAAYTGIASTSAYIIAPQKTKDVQSELLTDIGGWESASITMRDKFDCELYPFSYNASSDPDLDDWDALASWLASKKVLWASVEAGSRTYPPSSANAVPVNIEAVSEGVNRTAGTHNVTLTLRVKATI